jgi:anti-sigma regulatory factor (Ser/Thr protein kinase)
MGAGIVRARFPGDVKAPADARTFVRRQLDGSARRDDVVLVVSELVTNSVRAGAEQVDVVLEVHGDRIDLEVTDDAGGWPAQRDARLDDDGGRGLSIVEQLADRWVVSPRRRGKIVKARFVGAR